MSKADKRFLEYHGNRWRVAVPVPRNLQAKVGKTKLKRSLRTDSLTVANTLKWAVVVELQRQIRLSGQGTAADPLLAEALVMREALRGADGAVDEPAFTVRDAISLRADEIAGDPIGQDPETRDLEYDPARQAQAGYYYKIAAGLETPLTVLLEQWHIQSVNRKERTKGDDVRALRYLDSWCKAHHVSPTIEAISRKVGGRFIGDLPMIAVSAANGQRLANKTANKYLSSLSGYWKWLKGRGMVEENIWRGQFLPKLRTDVDDRERPFTDEEVAFPSSLSAKSCTFTRCGSPLGR